MNIEKIQSTLRLKGIDNIVLWFGRGDGPYLKARIRDTNEAIVNLIPICDEDDNDFIEFIQKKCKWGD